MSCALKATYYSSVSSSTHIRKHLSLNAGNIINKQITLRDKMTSISIPVGKNIDEADRPIGLDGDHRDIHGGTVLSFHNLSFFTNQYSGCPPRKKKNNILDNVR